jgi:hypothetical protein
MTAAQANHCEEIPVPRKRIREIVSPELAAIFVQLDQEVARRKRAEEEVDAASASCRDLVVSLLRAGIPRRELVNYPFSSAWLTRIQQEEGLIQNPRKEPAS